MNDSRYDILLDVTSKQQPETTAPTTEYDPADASAEPDPSFNDFNLAPQLFAALSDAGYERPTPIQTLAIPQMLSGNDVVALASTGTGKTAAFALPVLTQLAQDLASKATPGRAPRALILTPTRELALQVCEAFESYAKQMPQLTLLPVYGGQGYGIQLQALRRGVDVIVGTPGRIIDHMTSGRLDLSAVEHVVLDEADEMLTMGFEEEVDQILGQTPETKQVALFSATMPPRIRKLANKHLNDPVEVSTRASSTQQPQISQRYLVVQHALKIEALTRVLEVINSDGVIVFARTKNQTEVLAEKLRARGYASAALNGDVPQVQRERTVEQFKSGSLDILVATDVAARGLDVDRVSHVINVDIPGDIQSYTHRIGRTGRAGRQGEAITFITPRERYFLGQIRKSSGKEPEQMAMPTVAAINSSRLSRFDDAITAALAQDSRIDEFRAIIDHYVRHHNVPEVDVAAALAVVSQGDEPMLLDESQEIRMPAPRERGDREDRGGRFGDAGRSRSERSRHGDVSGWARYRIEVGHRHNATPRHIMGALANEGGLVHQDFGQIDIHQTFSLVELRHELTEEQRSRLSGTRISGRKVDIKVDQGRPVNRPSRDASRSERPYSPDRGGAGRGARGADRGGRGADRGGRDYDRQGDRKGRGFSTSGEDRRRQGRHAYGGREEYRPYRDQDDSWGRPPAGKKAKSGKRDQYGKKIRTSKNRGR